LTLKIFASAIGALPQSDFRFIKYFDLFGDTNIIEFFLHVAHKCAWAGKRHFFNFHLNSSNSQKSHGATFGLSGGGSNGDGQEYQSLPAPSEVGHSQYEEKGRLIAFSSVFRPSGCRNRPECHP
jgi:hypothetical protein